MNGLTELQVANLFTNVFSLSLFYGTIFGFAGRALLSILPKGRNKKPE